MQNTKGMAIASLVCGIAGVLSFWLNVGAVIGVILGVVAIILGVKVRKNEDENKSLATGGMVCGIIAVAIDVTAFACAICIVCAAGTALASAGAL